MSAAPSRVAAVVLNWNQEADTAECLSSPRAALLLILQASVLLVMVTILEWRGRRAG